MCVCGGGGGGGRGGCESKNCKGRERQRRLKLDNIGLITSAIWLGASVAIKMAFKFFCSKKEIYLLKWRIQGRGPGGPALPSLIFGPN